jgi:AraC-like DNA-binding protein
MDESTHHDGYFLAGRIDSGDAPSPWLRLAHHQTYVNARSDRSQTRHILDHEFIIQERNASWIEFPDRRASAALPAGSVTLVAPGLVHGQAFTTGSHYAIHFDLVPQHGLQSNEMVIPHRQTLHRSPRSASPYLMVREGDHLGYVPMVQTPGDIDWWMEASRRLVDVWSSGQHRRPGRRFQSAAILSEMMYRFCFRAEPHGSVVGSERTTDDAETRVSRVLSGVDPRDRRTSIVELAGRAGVGETVFRATAKRLTGTTPREWLEQRRCERAVILLKNTTLTIRAVAEACGYDDPYHFSRVVRRRYGRSPTEMRQA